MKIVISKIVLIWIIVAPAVCSGSPGAHSRLRGLADEEEFTTRYYQIGAEKRLLGKKKVGPKKDDGNKVDICHATGNSEYVLISVKNKSMKAHARHKDGFPGGPVPGKPGYFFDDRCKIQQDGTLIPAITGGSVDLMGVATVTFPAGAFSTDTRVLVEKSTDPVVDETFGATTAIFRPGARLNYEVKIYVDTEPSEFGTVTVSMDVPAAFLGSVGSGNQVEVFAQVSQASEMEGPFPVFLLLGGSRVTTEGKIEFELPRYAFSLSETSGKYEAIITLAPTPGQNDTSRRELAPLETTGVCKAAAIQCPLDSCDDSLLTSGFGPRVHPVLKTIKFHTGIDLAGSTGDPIYAVADGTVTRAGSFSGFGNEVNLQHKDGSFTLYAHMSRILVAVGNEVKAGDKIGEVGSTGGLSTGPHLHLTYAPNGQLYNEKVVIDPWPCLKQIVGAITVGDTGSAADDSFQLTIDGGWIIGTTGIGEVTPLSVNNIRPGTHQLALKSVVAPDDVGTFYIQLNDGWTFLDGTTTKDFIGEGYLSEGEERTWSFSVPGPCVSTYLNPGECIHASLCTAKPGFVVEKGDCPNHDEQAGFRCCFKPDSCTSSSGASGVCLRETDCDGGRRVESNRCPKYGTPLAKCCFNDGIVPSPDDRWTIALETATTNGKWLRTTADQCINPTENWAGGIQRSELIAQQDEAMLSTTDGLLDNIMRAAAEFDLPVGLILGLASKESSMGAGLNAEGFPSADPSNNGFGLLQVDRADHSELQGFPDPFSYEHIKQGVQQLVDNINFFDCECGQECNSNGAQLCLPSGPEWMTNCPWDDGWKLRAALVAYNAGRGSACTKAGLDHLAARNSDGSIRYWSCDYSSDVIARAKYYSTKYINI